MTIEKFQNPPQPTEQACVTIASLYLQWFNDFLSIERFAEYHGLHKDEAEMLIKLGRKVANRPHPDA